jgi:hypothetical protein
MTRERAEEGSERINIFVPNKTLEIADRLMQARLKGDNFSELLRDLIIEEHNRPHVIAQAELQWLREAYPKVLAENVKIKQDNEKAKEEVLKWKDQYRGLKSAIKRHYAEESAKKAGSTAT